MSIITREVNSIEVYQRAEDGYLSLTKMAQAAGKKINDYLRLESTKAFLEALSTDTGIPVTELVQVRQGGSSVEQGSWGHPQVAMHCAQWCSAEFAVLVSKWVFEWMGFGKAPQLEPPDSPLPPTPLATDLALLRSLLQVKPAHPFVKWQGTLLASTQAVAAWLEIDADKVQGFHSRRSEEFQAIGVTTRTIPKTLRAKLQLSNRAHTITAWTPRALVHLAALVAEQSLPAQQLTALTGTLPQLAALSLDDQIDELYQRVIEAEGITVQSARNFLSLYLDLGQRLTEKREALKYGEWLPWLQQKGINDRRAQRAMQLWEGREKLKGQSREITLTEALALVTKRTLKTADSEPETIDITPVVEPPIQPAPLPVTAPIPQTPPPDPKLLVLDRIQQATRTATEIEALPDGSTLKVILTGQLSRAVQLINFTEFAEAIEQQSKPRIEPDPVSIADHAKLIGKHLSPFQVQTAGQHAARWYRDRYGSNPAQRAAVINGAVVQINLYPERDLDLVEQAIALALES